MIKGSFFFKVTVRFQVRVKDSFMLTIMIRMRARFLNFGYLN